MTEQEKTLAIMSEVAINLSKSMNPPFICSIKSSPPTISAPAALASSILSPANLQFWDQLQILDEQLTRNTRKGHNKLTPTESHPLIFQFMMASYLFAFNLMKLIS